MTSSDGEDQVRVLDETLEFTLQQFCSCSDLDSETVIELVAEGIIEPRDGAPGRWRFDGYMLKRVQIATRLQHDLGVNLPGVAVILDLLEELEALRQKSEV